MSSPSLNSSLIFLHRPHCHLIYPGVELPCLNAFDAVRQLSWPFEGRRKDGFLGFYWLKSMHAKYNQNTPVKQRNRTNVKDITLTSKPKPTTIRHLAKDRLCNQGQSRRGKSNEGSISKWRKRAYDKHWTYIRCIKFTTNRTIHNYSSVLKTNYCPKERLSWKVVPHRDPFWSHSSSK